MLAVDANMTVTGHSDCHGLVSDTGILTMTTTYNRIHVQAEGIQDSETSMNQKNHPYYAQPQNALIPYYTRKTCIFQL